MTLTYQDYQVISGSGLSHAGRKYNLASIYDPDVSGAGHQPYGHDQWATLYKTYRVVRATIKATFYQSETNGTPQRCGVFLDKDGAIDSDLSTKLEQMKGRFQKLLLCNNREKVTVSNYYNPRRFFTIKDYDDDHQITADFGNDPTLPAYCVVWTQSIDRATAPTADINVDIIINYVVELSNPIPLGGS